jgi:hypothetical protein
MQNGAWVYDIRGHDEHYRQNITLNVASAVMSRHQAGGRGQSGKYPDAPAGSIKYTGNTFRLTTWSLWGGTALMVFASLASLALQWRNCRRAIGGLREEEEGPRRNSRTSKSPWAGWSREWSPSRSPCSRFRSLAFNISWYAGLIAIGMSVLPFPRGLPRHWRERTRHPSAPWARSCSSCSRASTPARFIPNLAAAGIAANSASPPAPTS